jgi:hypothetical protein
MQLLTREGPTQDEIQIIGVELAMQESNGQLVELDMFACRHTLPRDPYGNRQVRITLHTSQGDFTYLERFFA